MTTKLRQAGIYEMDPMVALKLLWEVIKVAVKYEPFNKALDNFFKRTVNKLDDMAWAMLEKAAGMDPKHRETFLQDAAATLQTIHNLAKDAGTLAELKKPVATWGNEAVVWSLIEGDNTVGMG